jgi:hypothetical protein
MPSDTRGNKTAFYVDLIQKGGLDLLAKTLEVEVRSWLAKHGLPAEKNRDLWFSTYLNHHDRPMGGGIGLVIATEESAILNAIGGNLQKEWCDFLASRGFIHEFYDHLTMDLWAAWDRELEAEILKAFSFDWHSRLIAPDYAAIYEGIYAYFADNPQRIKDLHWREFEELLASIFLEQGYKTMLGAGRADEGVDLRLVESNIYGDQVTVVQAKKYRNPIKLEQVAALTGVVYDQHAERGIFVTTSRYLPSAQRFAARQARKIVLATSTDVASWCEVIRLQKPAAEQLNATILNSDLDPRKAVCANVGYNTTDYQFAYIVAESPTAVRLAFLPNTRIRTYEDDNGRRFDSGRGKVVPDLLQGLGPETKVITARRRQSFSPGDVMFHGDDGNSYWPWNQKPLNYDTND